MDITRVRSILNALPHVAETLQWGENLVFWVGDKAVGGKMMALAALDAETRAGSPVFSFHAGPEMFSQLLEVDGVVPAPYLARAFWVAVLHWEAFPAAEWREHLERAHALTLGKLPARTRTILQLPQREQARLVADRRRALKAKAETAAGKRDLALKPAARATGKKAAAKKAGSTKTPR